MTPLPQPAPVRASRIRLAETTPAVLRFANGVSAQAQLRTVSVTGGLLSLPQNLDHGLRCKLIFVTSTGPILSSAELLRPMSNTLQPFRFVKLDRNDQQRLGAAIQTTLRTKREEAWITRYRAAIDIDKEPTGRFKVGLRAATLVTLGLAGIACVMHFAR